MSTSTVDEIHICPYTGLRSFTGGGKPLFLGGRDLQVDQYPRHCSRAKYQFLMVTGASGEEKIFP